MRRASDCNFFGYHRKWKAGRKRKKGKRKLVFNINDEKMTYELKKLDEDGLHCHFFSLIVYTVATSERKKERAIQERPLIIIIIISRKNEFSRLRRYIYAEE